VDRNDQVENRHDKLTALRKQGVLPFGETRFDKERSIKELVDAFADGQRVSTAGRLSAKRGHGALSFADVRDASGKVQLCVKQDRIGEGPFAFFQNLDLGDIVGVTGELFKTRTGEVTVQVASLTLLAKALRPLPEKWHGLKDVEVRYRKRYLDLIANEPVRTIFKQRSRMVHSLRATLERRGFIEVETPMMHDIAGGAAGEPFTTHHNALDLDLSLRLAPELHLKRLLVGGLDRVYEINRSFRNEGLSTRHNPEFTMLEAYEAYGNMASMMRLVEELICEAATALTRSLTFQYQGKPVDLTPPWERVSFAQTLEDMGLKPASSEAEIQRVLEAKGMKVKGLTRSQLVRLVEQLFDPSTRAKPLFVTDYWTELSPLAKSLPDNPAITDRFELFLGGMEVANAYSELNDPIEQRKRFEAQLEGGKGQETGGRGKDQPTPRAPRPVPPERRIDEDFLEALEYGMPPAGGLGIGVDRLAMLLLDQPSIKDVILFPLLRPEAEQGL